MTTAATIGLRERKKAQTRELIAHEAQRLFVERGFEQVTMSAVAAAADVSEKTVFNYFPTKEDLVFRGLEVFEERLAAAIRQRPAGEPALDAFMRFVGEPGGLLAETGPADRERLVALNRMIGESPALLIREQVVFARHTDALADLLAEEGGERPGAIDAWVAANAMMGVHRVLVAHVRRQVIAGVAPVRIRREVRAQVRSAAELLGRGLSGYPAR